MNKTPEKRADRGDVFPRASGTIAVEASRLHFTGIVDVSRVGVVAIKRLPAVIAYNPKLASQWHEMMADAERWPGLPPGFTQPRGFVRRS